MAGRTGRVVAFAVMGISIAAILICGYTLHRVRQSNEVFEDYVKTMGKVQAVLAKIDADYVDSVSVPEIEEHALPEIIKQLDPHSEYFSAKVMKRVSEPLRGDFDGIGVTFNMLTDTVIVQSVIGGGPSEKAGILPGDRFLKVDSVPVAGVKFRQDSIVRLLRGQRGTEVKIEVERAGGGDLIPFTIVRDRIPINSIDAAYMADSLTGVVRISRFARNTLEEFRDALIKLSKEGMQRLVLDLRDNGGGFLEAAHYIASQFLKNGELITYVKGRNRPRRDLKAVGDGALRNIPLVILVNEYSASSSEIVAGAMQDNDRAVIVGRRTFGKGLVQEQYEFPDGAGLRLTVARYYTPSGRCIQKPYKLGAEEDYAKDLYERWEHGEMYAKDSVRQDTLEVYHTVGGREVYGGGGIMPDVFVPVDTVGSTHFLRQVRRRALTVRFAQRFVDAHRKQLEQFHSAKGLLEYLKTQGVLQQFLQFAKGQELAPKPGEVQQSRQILETQLYAHIARGVLDNEGFYPIILAIDDALLKGIEILRSPNPLEAVTEAQQQ